MFSPCKPKASDLNQGNVRFSKDTVEVGRPFFLSYILANKINIRT